MTVCYDFITMTYTTLFNFYLNLWCKYLYIVSYEVNLQKPIQNIHNKYGINSIHQQLITFNQKSDT